MEKVQHWRLIDEGKRLWIRNQGGREKIWHVFRCESIDFNIFFLVFSLASFAPLSTRTGWRQSIPDSLLFHIMGSKLTNWRIFLKCTLRSIYFSPHCRVWQESKTRNSVQLGTLVVNDLITLQARTVKEVRIVLLRVKNILSMSFWNKPFLFVTDVFVKSLFVEPVSTCLLTQ